VQKVTSSRPRGLMQLRFRPEVDVFAAASARSESLFRATCLPVPALAQHDDCSSSTTGAEELWEATAPAAVASAEGDWQPSELFHTAMTKVRDRSCAREGKRTLSALTPPLPTPARATCSRRRASSSGPSACPGAAPRARCADDSLRSLPSPRSLADWTLSAGCSPAVGGPRRRMICRCAWRWARRRRRRRARLVSSKCRYSVTPSSVQRRQPPSSTLCAARRAPPAPWCTRGTRLV